MARAKTSPKKRTTKKTLKGSGGLKTTNKLSWKKLALLILPIAHIGGFFVYKSNAATGSYTFVRYGSQMSGGNLYTKSNGTSYRHITGTQKITTFVSNTEFKSRQFGAHYIDAKAPGKRLVIRYGYDPNLPNGGYNTSGYPDDKYSPTGSGNVYSPDWSNVSSSIGWVSSGKGGYITVEIENGTSSDYVQVDTIYGKP